jgi:threonyl-tRNA synthetase
VGKREVESGMLSIRNRQTGGKMENMSLNELIAKIQDEINGKPFKPLPLPKLLSKRPLFHG